MPRCEAGGNAQGKSEPTEEPGKVKAGRVNEGESSEASLLEVIESLAETMILGQHETGLDTPRRSTGCTDS